MKVACGGKPATAVVPKVWVRQNGPSIEAGRNRKAEVDNEAGRHGGTNDAAQADRLSEPKRARLATGHREGAIRIAPSLKRRALEPAVGERNAREMKRARVDKVKSVSSVISVVHQSLCSPVCPIQCDTMEVAKAQGKGVGHEEKPPPRP